MLYYLLQKWFRYSTAGPALVRFYLAPHVKLHYIHASDTEFHTHPWNALSIIFGWYVETTEDGRHHLRLGLNWISARRKHKVTVFGPVWTLLVNGPRVNEHWHYGAQTKPWEGSDQERSAADLVKEKHDN